MVEESDIVRDCRVKSATSRHISHVMWDFSCIQFTYIELPQVFLTRAFTSIGCVKCVKKKERYVQCSRRRKLDQCSRYRKEKYQFDIVVCYWKYYAAKESGPVRSNTAELGPWDACYS